MSQERGRVNDHGEVSPRDAVLETEVRLDSGADNDARNPHGGRLREPGTPRIVSADEQVPPAACELLHESLVGETHRQVATGRLTRLTVRDSKLLLRVDLAARVGPDDKVVAPAPVNVAQGLDRRHAEPVCPPCVRLANEEEGVPVRGIPVAPRSRRRAVMHHRDRAPRLGVMPRPPARHPGEPDHVPELGKPLDLAPRLEERAQDDVVPPARPVEPIAALQRPGRRPQELLGRLPAPTPVSRVEVRRDHEEVGRLRVARPPGVVDELLDPERLGSLGGVTVLDLAVRGKVLEHVLVEEEAHCRLVFQRRVPLKPRPLPSSP
mmetsp:Transcript_10113/g.28643  ORF Transcript_10113/g.28643 Transcript_10113/m.28643 type:complete len:322 (-) Transcript_10113:276-1241(-)